MSVFHNIYKSKLEEVHQSAINEDASTRGSMFMSFLTSAISTFKWGNLPKNTLISQPEEYLIYWARLAFFKDDADEFKMFPCYPAGTLLENGEYDRYTIVSRNGKQWIKSRDEIALCYDNSMIIPFIVMIEELSGKCSVALEAVDASLRKAILPAIISCEDEQQVGLLSDLYDKKQRLLPFRITLNKGFSEKDIQTFNVFNNATNDILSLWDVYVRYRNLYYTTMGINNVEIQKRERLTEAEGSGNDEITRYTFLTDRYQQRQKFIEEVKEKFNYDLTIEINRDVTTVYELSIDNDDKIEAAETTISKGANIPQTKPDTEKEDKDDGAN